MEVGWSSLDHIFIYHSYWEEVGDLGRGGSGDRSPRDYILRAEGRGREGGGIVIECIKVATASVPSHGRCNAGCT